MLVEGATTCNSTLQVANTLGVTLATTLSNTLLVEGATTCNSTLQVANTLGVTLATTLSNTLLVEGATTCNSTLSVANTLGVTLATTLSNTLLVELGTTCNSTLVVNGAFTLNDVLTPSGTGQVLKKITAADANATLNTTHFGGLITQGATNADRVYTLPTANTVASGSWFEFFSVLNSNTTFAAQTHGEIVAFNTAAANSIAFASANELVGAAATFYCNGVKWYAADIKGTPTIVADAT